MPHTMMITRRVVSRIAPILLVAPALTMCSTSPSQTPDPGPVPPPESSSIGEVQSPNLKAAAGTDSDFTFDRSSLALFIREFSRWSGRNVVLMNGLDLIQVGPYEFRDQTPDTVLERVVADTRLQIHRAPAYDFLFSEGYESLTRFSVDERLDPALAARRADVRFGADTPLYAAFALLSHALNITLLGDNVVAGAASGEVQLTDVPLADALEALLQSARIAPGNVKFETAESLVFLYAPANPMRTNLFLNAGDVDPNQLEFLDRRVNLTLPYPPDRPDHLRGDIGAVRLQACLDSAGAQLGVRLMADEHAADLPVNPAVMHDVTVKTALRLLIQQWPVSTFAYEVVPRGVRIVYVGPAQQSDTAS